jgi:fucose permease
MYAFIVLGLPDGMIGTAWPAMRHSFHAPLEDVGLVLLAATAGGISTSSVSGLVMGRVGPRVTIMMAATSASLGAAVAVLAPSFPALVVAGLFLGMSAGLVDSAVNVMAALAGRARLLNLLHGFYGIGTTVAPLVVTAALLAVSSWRPAYGLLLLVELSLLAVWWWAGRRPVAVDEAPVPAGPAPPAPAAGVADADSPGPSPGPDRPGPDSPGPGPDGPPALRSRRRLALVVAMGLFVFLVYTGFEVGIGQWEPSYDRGPLHMGAGATGVAVFGYWAALTLARLSLAVPRRPPPPETVVRWGCLVAAAGAALVWWGPATWATLTGFVVIGAALAGVFPALVTLTPDRVGERTARHVIGWQIGAAGLGGSAVSAVLGVIFQHAGFNWLGPCLGILAAVLWFSSELLRRLGPLAPAAPAPT